LTKSRFGDFAVASMVRQEIPFNEQTISEKGCKRIVTDADGKLLFNDLSV
jgi:hypothetical protein